MTSFSSADALQLSDFRSLATYFLGLLIIVMYSKDKFNMPTYDKETVGTFAQFPPQSLTIDSRYQWGRMVYVFLLAALYTAISIIGPTIFNTDDSGAAQNKLGLVATAQTWQVGAATFLISTGAARDDSLLGRIELFIRRYAHKIAYIPSTVSDLAFGLRNLKLDVWLRNNPIAGEDKFDERRAALAALAGEENLRKLEQNPDYDGDAAALVRANVLFYTLNQIFKKASGRSNPRLDELVDLDENRQTFERLESVQRSLAAKMADAASGSDDAAGKNYAEIQRFSKEVSLTIAVLLSRTARNDNDLAQRLEALGLSNSYENNRSDHFGYVFLVNLSIFAGALVAIPLLFAPELLKPAGAMSKGRDVLQGLITIMSGLLIHVVTFRVLDYARDKYLDTQDWRESLEGYSKVVLTSVLLTSVICIVSAILLLSLFGLLNYVAYNPMAFACFILFNVVIAAVAVGFGLVYFRQAARLPRADFRLPRNFLSGTALLHGALAALFVVCLNFILYSYQVRTLPAELYGRIRTDFTLLQPIVEKADKAAIYSGYSADDMARISQSLNTLGKSLGNGAGDVFTQLEQLSGICLALDQGAERAGKKEKLFDDPSRCELGPALSHDPANLPPGPTSAVVGAVQLAMETARNEGLFYGFLRSLPVLYESIEAMGGRADFWAVKYPIWIFSPAVAFAIAVGFGVGVSHWRAWWLYNEIDRAGGNGARFKEQLRKLHGESLDFEKCLVFPIVALDYLTPLEALRYEDYRVKLFTEMQRKEIVWEGCEVQKQQIDVSAPGVNAAFPR